MPCYSLDINLQGMLRYGLDYVVAHPEVVDEIFAGFKEPHLKNMYGQKEIDQIRTWIISNEIPVVTAWSLTPQRIPCLSVHIASSAEDTANAFLGDHAGIAETAKTARTIINEFVPTSYDNTTGVIVVPATIDISLVRPAHIIKDAKGELYEITDIIGQDITVDMTGAALDPRKLWVQSFVDYSRAKIGETYINESVDVGVHGHADHNVVLWLYYIAVWILLRFKPMFEDRCMDLTTWSASDFKRDSVYLGENCFSRWMRVSARTRVSWTEDPYEEIDTIVATVDTDE